MRRMLCAAAIALLSVPAIHADVLDQSQTMITTGNYFAVGANPAGIQTVVGQVFTAGMDGYLHRVHVYLENDASSPVTGGVLLSVQTVTIDGLPSGREIANATIPVCLEDPIASCVPPAGSPGWVEFNLSPGILNTGTRYALILRAWGGGYLRWYDHVGPSAYPRGYMAGNTGSGWWAGDYDDMTFKTYMSPPALDQSQTSGEGYRTVQLNQPMAQTFTAGINGYLRRIRLLLENQTATSPIAVSIQTINRMYGLPTGTQIGSGTIPAISLPPAGYPGWVDVTIDDPVVVAGTEYVIILSSASTGSMRWRDTSADNYLRGRELLWQYGAWWTMGAPDTAFETYVLQPISRSMPPPPRVITPCVARVCPETKGGLTPADSVDGIRTHFLFKEKLDGTVQGTFSFTDDWPDGISFQDCTTESDSTCWLTVTTFQCSGPHAMTVAGSFKRAGDVYASSYELNLTGTRKGSGTFTLEIPRKTYTFTHDQILDVSCP